MNQSLRYFIADFKTSELTIQNSIDNNKKAKVIPFRNIIDCTLQNNVCTYYGLKDFTFEFVMKTLNHYYVLFAQSEFEKGMWMSAFKYIQVSSMQVANLIRQAFADEKIVAKLKKRSNSM